MIKWFVLILAGMLEVCWAVGMKYSRGFSHTGWSLFTFVTLAASMYLLSISLKNFELGNAYAIWTGIGAIGTVLLGIILFNEPVNTGRILCLGLILAGIIGLRLIQSAE